MWSHEIYAWFSHRSGECSQKRRQVSTASPKGKEDPQQLRESPQLFHVTFSGP